MRKSTIYLAGSTFWGGRDFLDNLPGVLGTQLGVADGSNDTITETYWIAKVDSASLGSEECIKVEYDADVISLPLLLKAFFETVDPFSTKKQINLVEGMPEAKIMFEDAEDEVAASKAVSELQSHFDHSVTVEVVPLDGFREAGKYAVDYIERNFSDDFIVGVDAAKKFAAEHEDEFGK